MLDQNILQQQRTVKALTHEGRTAVNRPFRAGMDVVRNGNVQLFSKREYRFQTRIVGSQTFVLSSNFPNHFKTPGGMFAAQEIHIDFRNVVEAVTDQKSVWRGLSPTQDSVVITTENCSNDVVFLQLRECL